METAAKSRLAFQGDVRLKDDVPGRKPRDPEGFFVVSPEKGGAKQSVGYLLTSFEERIRLLRRTKNLGQHSCAEEILAILRELIRSERSSDSLEFEVPDFFHSLWAESSIRALVENLLREAKAIVHPRCSAETKNRYVVANQISLLDLFLEWYGARRAALRLFEGQPLYDAAAVVVQGIVHDRLFLGERGFEAVCAARIDGFESQSLWLAATLFCDGNQVTVKPGWEYWVNDSELFVVRRGKSRNDSERNFASVMPIVPSDQRAIYQELRLFVPYRALDLPANSRQQIDCEVSLLSSSGAVLSADACTQTIAVPDSARAAEAIPSPNALGFWSRNVGQGDTVSILNVEQRTRVEARREIHFLQVQYDLSIVARVGESLRVEVRVLTRDGNLIESEFPSYAARDGTFLLEKTLIPSDEISQFPGVNASIPLVALELDAGSHDLFVEVIVLTREHEIVCGDITRVELTVAERVPGQLVDLDQIHADAPTTLDAGMYIEYVSVNSAYVFNTRDAVRAEIVFADQSDVTELMQIKATLLCKSTEECRGRPIIHGLTLRRSPDKREHSALFVFDSEEVLKVVGISLDKRVALRIEVMNGFGEIQLSTERTVTLTRAFGVERRMFSSSHYGRQAVEVIDAVARETPQRGGETILELVVNFDLIAAESSNYSLYIEPQTSSRETKSAARISSEGLLVEVPFPEVRAQIGEHRALLQESRFVRLPQSVRTLGADGIKMMLFAPSGRLLQVVYQRLSHAEKGASSSVEPAERNQRTLL